MSITAKELARELGLSEAAVSFALNGKRGVSERTRLRVLEKARELGYDFTRAGAAMPAARGTLCLVQIRRSGALLDRAPFLAGLTEAARAAAAFAGYGLDVLSLDLDVTAALAGGAYAGLIVLGTELNAADAAPLAAATPPRVFLDVLLNRADADCVCPDDALGGYLAARHLLSLRRGQPGYLRSAYRTDAFTRRARGFFDAVREGGFSPARCAVHALTPSREGAAADMRELLAAGLRPARCYFADSDEIAAGAADALAGAGLRVPQDVALTGFGDTPLALKMGFASVRLPWGYLGAMAVQRLAQRIRGDGHVPARLLAGSELAVRGGAPDFK